MTQFLRLAIWMLATGLASGLASGLACWAQAPPTEPSSAKSYEQALAEAARLEGQGKLDEAIGQLAPWVAKFPDRAAGRHRLGIAYYQRQNYPGAIEHLSAALRLEAEDSPAWRQTVEHLGLAYYFSHRTADALPLIERALGWKPQDAYLAYALAMCHVYARDPVRARQAFGKLFAIPGESAQASLLASHFMSRENFVPEAETLIREAQQSRPNLPGIHYRLGMIALTKGENDQAAGHFRQELQRNPLHPMAWHYLGEARARLGKLDEAVPPLQRAIWLNLRNTLSYLRIASVYHRQEKFALAENALQQALSLDPRSYEARFLLARIYQKTGRRELARQEMARARELRESTQP